MIDVTVAICTWNRAALLEQTLHQLLQLEIPSHITWELLVVNNCCTDGTDQVLESFAPRLPLRRLYEPQPGLSHARNCAIQAARGNLLIWTDDDVLVSSNWLRSYTEAAHLYPEVSFFGGAVIPWFESPPPPWVASNLKLLEGPFALADPEDVDRIPVGANMAFRTAVLQQHTFDTRLGRTPSSLLGGEESTLFEQLLQHGYTGKYLPKAVVRHFVPTTRMTPQYIRHWFAGAGRTLARLHESRQLPKWFHVPRWAWAEYLKQQLIYLANFWRRDANWLKALRDSARMAGYIAESRAAAKKQAN